MVIETSFDHQKKNPVHILPKLQNVLFCLSPHESVGDMTLLLYKVMYIKSHFLCQDLLCGKTSVISVWYIYTDIDDWIWNARAGVNTNTSEYAPGISLHNQINVFHLHSLHQLDRLSDWMFPVLAKHPRLYCCLVIPSHFQLWEYLKNRKI